MFFKFLGGFFFFANEISLLVPFLDKECNFSLASRFTTSLSWKFCLKPSLWTGRRYWRRTTEDHKEQRVKNLPVSGFRRGQSLLVPAAVPVHRHSWCTRCTHGNVPGVLVKGVRASGCRRPTRSRSSAAHSTTMDTRHV